jgi:ABC-2 type transport system ATP-binding protein
VSAPGRPAAVALHALARRFGDVVAVDGLTFAVAEGELFGLVGPDGAGKTTTLRLLAGVLRPSGGDAIVAGASVVRTPEAVKPRLGYMPQRFGLYEELTVRENVLFHADLHRVPAGERPARLERLWAFSGLGPFQARRAGQLSGGMKQKLALCACLIHRPRLLLLDEPTFGVDPVSRRELWLILHEMVAEGVTALVSTAYLDEAERCDRVALLDQGRVVALDTPPALQRRLPGGLLEVRAADAGRAREVVAGLPCVRRATRYGDRLHLLIKPDDGGSAGDGGSARIAAASAAVGAALAAAAIPAELRVVEPTLEDVFLELVAAEAQGG